MRWGRVRAFKHDTSIDSFLEKMSLAGRVDEVVDSQQLFDILEGHRVQGIFALPMVYLYELKSLKNQNSFKLIDVFPNEKSVAHGIVLSQKTFTKQEISFWKNILESMKKDGTIEQIINRYLPKEEASKALIR